MDLWKLLILGVIAVGLFLVLWSPPELPKLPEGLRVEEGTFRIVTPAGTTEEIFGIYPVDVGFRVVGIRHKAGKVVVEGDFLYSSDWVPLAGTVTQRSPAEVRWIFASANNGLTVRKQIGARETVETLPVPGVVFPTDRELLVGWVALVRQNMQGEVWLWDVRQGDVRKGILSPPNETKLDVFGRAIPAQRLTLAWDNVELRAYRQGELLLGLQGENFSAYLLEILPEGIRELSS